MDAASARVFEGKYYPKRGRPKSAFYAVVNGIVVGPAFRDRRTAEYYAIRTRQMTLEAPEPSPEVSILQRYEHCMSTVLKEQDRVLRSKGAKRRS